MLGVLAIMFFIIFFSNSNYVVAQEAFIMWATKVVPSLFPFLICIDLLKRTPFLQLISKLLTPIMKPIFNVPGCGAFALSMGLASGYPTGAKLTSELYIDKKCSKSEAERLLAFTNTSGPLFIIGTCGIGMFGSSQIGSLLLISHILGAITVGILFRKYHSEINPNGIIPQKLEEINTSETLNSKNLGKYVGFAIQNSFSTLILIGGYIIFFAIISNILIETGIITAISRFISLLLGSNNLYVKYIESLICGLLEVTNGISMISALGTSAFTICLSAFVLRIWRVINTYANM
ncbi:MAG: hypothetical protein IJX99_10000 [Clostridia bacterium]|nr:hypothetical protein [Clostridia bacterium]